jgi:hypothetical protein
MCADVLSRLYYSGKKKKNQQQKSTAVLKTAFRSEGKPVVSPPTLDKESVVSYAGAFGCQYDDMSFLDCKYDNIKFQTGRFMSKLEHGYEVLLCLCACSTYYHRLRLSMLISFILTVHLCYCVV